MLHDHDDDDDINNARVRFITTYYHVQYVFWYGQIKCQECIIVFMRYMFGSWTRQSTMVYITIKLE